MKRKLFLFIGCALLMQQGPAWGQNSATNLMHENLFAHPFASIEQKITARIVHFKKPVYRQEKHKTRRFKLWRRLPRRIEATGNRVFIFDPRMRKWAAYDVKGKRVKSGIASGGSHFCPDINRKCHTPVGTFRVYRTGGEGCASTQFPLGRGGAPMPYCMFFHEGYAIHGSPDVPNFNASHGCIRVQPKLAKWLNESFITHGTTVIIRPY